MVQKFTSNLYERAAVNVIDVVGEVLKNNITDQLRKCKYIFVLSEGSTDVAVIEELLFFLLFMADQGKPEVKFLPLS